MTVTAAAQYKLAADQQHPQGPHQLGLSHLHAGIGGHGSGVAKPHVDRAAAFFALAAAANDVRGLHHWYMGVCLLRGCSLWPEGADQPTAAEALLQRRWSESYSRVSGRVQP